jgi:hypothetical protein
MDSLLSIFRFRLLSFLFGLWCLLTPCVSQAIGTWTALATAPPLGVNNSMVLSDGTVIGMNGAGQCVKLTPSINGSYINGTWTILETMNYSRLFFASQLLTNGDIFVAGGEYGTGNTNGEVYDPLANTWTTAPNTPGGIDNFLDAISEILPNGNVLVAPVGPSTFGGTLIWNAASSTWLTGPTLYRGGSQDEASWVLLPDTSILTIDPFGQNSERYIPSLNEWINDATVPVQMYNSALGEIGAGFLLPNGNAFFLGGTDNTAIYTPTGTTSPGSWAAGANIPNGYGVSDGPAAMLTDGNILCCVGNSSNYNGPSYFYEYNYVSNTFTPAPSPTSSTAGASYGSAPFGTSMLDLPDGNVLFIGGQNSGSLYVYTPGGTPLAAGKPVINSISQNLNGSYSLTGTGLNGISQGAAYGDDEQMNSNYPLVRMTNSSTGNVYYARTFNWNSTGVMTGAKVVTTQFSLPANLPAGTYSLVVVANGNPSAAVFFTNTPPAAPTGLTGTAGIGQTILSWNAVSGATAYNLKCLTTVGTPYFATVATVTGTSATNAGLVNDMSYFYVVTAVSAGGESADSAMFFLTPSGPPPVPAGVTAASDSFARIYLSWNASYGAASYIISRSLALNGPYTNLANTVNPFYTDSGLVNGVTYYYEISAVSAGGQSGNSAEAGAIAQAVVDFGFEVPSIGSGNYVYTPTGAFWNFSGTNAGYGSGLIANGSGFSNPNAPEGVQAAFVQSNGVISQVLSGFTPGTTYTIIYSAAQRSGASQHGGESWNVMIDSTVIQSNSPGGTSYSNYTATFVATAQTHTLSFVGTDLAGGDNTVFLDDVQVTIAPPVISNFSFELPSLGAGGYQYNPSGGSWAFNGASPSGSGIVANGSAFGNPNAPLGVQAAFVQEYGQFSQTISGFMQGATYTLAYSAAQRSGAGESWNVKIDNTVIQTNSPGGASYADYTAAFATTAGSHTLTFVGTDLATGDNTVFLDNISITSPPQPVAPLVTLTTPANSAIITNPATINLTATVVTNGNLISGVQFFDNATNLIGQATNPPYSFGWSNPNTGKYNVFARVVYNGGGISDSTAASIAVINNNVNFGFETPVIGSGNFEYNPSGASWTFSGASPSGSGIVANGSGFSNPNAPQGTQAAFVQEYGSISQTLDGFSPGTTYSVTFAAAQRSGASQHGGESWNVMIDNTVITNCNPGSTGYVNYTASFTASAPVHTLSFVGTDFVTGDNTVFLDNIQFVPPIPPVAPLIVLTSPANNTVFSAANPVNLAASVTPNGNTVVGVRFYNNTSNLITQLTVPYTYAWSNASAGASTVFAQLVFNGSNTVNSSVINITVTNPPPMVGGIELGANGQTLIISGSGLSARPYFLNAASNLTPPVVWMPVQTNLSGPTGGISFTNMTPTNAQQFFRISAP